MEVSGEAGECWEGGHNRSADRGHGQLISPKNLRAVELEMAVEFLSVLTLTAACTKIGDIDQAFGNPQSPRRPVLLPNDQSHVSQPRGW